MRSATITEVKNGLSALIDRVRAGESILVTDRGIPVARIEPVTAGPDPAGRIARLERAGILRSAVSPPSLDLLRTPGPPVRAGSSAVAAVIDERQGDR